MLAIHGVPFSAHTRKVTVALRNKGLGFELRPLIPIAPDRPDWFLPASPLGKIPVLEHGDFRIADSSVIALYLDRAFPERPLFPKDPARYATTLFIEELVDGSLAQHVLHGVLFQRVFGPKFQGIHPDEKVIAHALSEAIPPRLADLESRLVEDWFAGDFSYADITVASILMNLHYAGEHIDRERHPRLHAHLRRSLRQDAFLAHLREEAPAARGLGGLDTSLLDEVGC